MEISLTAPRPEGGCDLVVLVQEEELSGEGFNVDTDEAEFHQEQNTSYFDDRGRTSVSGCRMDLPSWPVGGFLHYRIVLRGQAFRGVRKELE